MMFDQLQPGSARENFSHSSKEIISVRGFITNRTNYSLTGKDEYFVLIPWLWGHCDKVQWIIPLISKRSFKTAILIHHQSYPIPTKRTSQTLQSSQYLKQDQSSSRYRNTRLIETISVEASRIIALLWPNISIRDLNFTFVRRWSS